MNYSLGEKLKMLREKKGMTQKEASKIIGCTHNMLSNYELDKREPNVALFKSIARFYNVSLDYLIGAIDYFKPLIANEQDKSQEREEKQLILMFQQLTDRQKGNIEGQIKAMNEQNELQETVDQTSVTIKKEDITKRAI